MRLPSPATVRGAQQSYSALQPRSCSPASPSALTVQLAIPPAPGVWKRGQAVEEVDLYRSDVVGSLLRPNYLKQARDRHDSHQISDAEFKRIEDRAVNQAVEMQTRAGLEVITDGELRRYAFWGHLIDAVEGFDKLGGWAIPFRNEKGEEIVQPRPVVVSKLRQKRPLCAEEFTYLRARTDRATKATIISAQQAAAYYDKKKSADAYPTVDAYLADLVDILRNEVEE